VGRSGTAYEGDCLLYGNCPKETRYESAQKMETYQIDCCVFNKVFDGECAHALDDEVFIIFSESGTVPRDECFTKCQQNSTCERASVGRRGTAYEGDCLLYGNCPKETRYESAEKMETYQINCGAGY